MEFIFQHRSRYSLILEYGQKNPCNHVSAFKKEQREKKPKVSETDAKRKVGQDFDSVWQDYRCKRTLITPASRLIYSVFNSILHLHKMLVFSCWDYNHNKLFADALGLHRVKKKKRKKKIKP